MNDYLAAVLFFLPAGLANMAPVLACRVPLLRSWNTPIDFGTTLRGKRLFGANKTWRGLIMGTFVGALSAVIIGSLYPNSVGQAPLYIIGGLLGFGALAGDALESMVKRQLNIDPGSSWFPFDQLDYIIGGLLAVSLVISVPTWVVITIFAVYFVMHIVVSYLAFKLGYKDKPI